MSAAAILFDENHSRGFKRHHSPDTSNKGMGGTNIFNDSQNHRRPRTQERKVTRATYSTKQKQNHCHEPDDYNQRGYERRIQDLKKTKIQKMQMSSKIIEVWLNDTLLDSAHLDIPGIILKPENKKPLTRYGIDRDQLLIGKISHEQIDRIYRALFVYSLGFYEMLNKTLTNSPE